MSNQENVGCNMFPYFKILGCEISTYLLCALFGIICALTLAMVRAGSPHFFTHKKDVFYAVLCAFIGALTGAKAFQLIGYVLRDGGKAGFWTMEHWRQMLSGVGVFYGGLIGGACVVLLYVYTSKLDLWEMADILIPSVLLFHVFGRIGCFCAGCCYGIEAKWGVALFEAINAPNGVPLIPVQLLEAFFNLLILVVFLIKRPERRCKGILLPFYLILYAIGRFVLEFYRGDAGRGVFLLSVSQWISLLVLPVGMILLHLVRKKNLRQTGTPVL